MKFSGYGKDLPVKEYRKYADDTDDDFVLEGEETPDEPMMAEAPVNEAPGAEEPGETEEAEEPEDFATETPLKNRPGRNAKGKFPLWIFIVIGVALIAAVVLAGIVRYEKNKPNRTQVDLYSYLGIDQGEIAVYLDDERIETEALLMDGEYYLANSFLQEYISDRFYYDSSLDKVLYTWQDQMAVIPLNDTTYYMVSDLNDTEGTEVTRSKTIAMRLEDELYLSLQFAMGTIAGYSYRIDSSPERIHIYTGDVTRDYLSFVSEEDEITIRVAPTIKAAVVGTWTVEECEAEMILYDTAYEDENDEGYGYHEPESGWWYIPGAQDDTEENAAEETGDEAATGEWTYVCSPNGLYGYVKTECIDPEQTYHVRFAATTEEEYSDLVREEEILLGWQGVYDLVDNTHVEELVSAAPQMNVISPTWYKVSDQEGNVSSFADADYVEYVHEQGLEIWPLISDFNFPYTDGMDEASFLKDAAARTYLIGLMMDEAATYGYDGWNIDFEHVPSDCGYDYIEFIRELSIACRRAGLVLSVDNYVPRSYNTQYMRADQGLCVDYVIVMGYDEHWAGCDEAGSTASLDFVTEGLDLMLEEVDGRKVIMGVPFYTRLWAQTTETDGTLSLTSTAYTMAGSQEVVDKLGLTEKWDDTVGQYVATGRVDNVYYSIWLEDAKSMRIRIKAIRERTIAGIAAWSLGYEEEGTWDILAAK